jgi:hypothetical protein
MIGYHCDGPECDTWVLGEERLLLTGWLEVNTLDDYSRMFHFCCRDCAGKYFLGASHPTESLDN